MNLCLRTNLYPADLLQITFKNRLLSCLQLVCCQPSTFIQHNCSKRSPLYSNMTCHDLIDKLQRSRSTAFHVYARKRYMLCWWYYSISIGNGHSTSRQTQATEPITVKLGTIDYDINSLNWTRSVAASRFSTFMTLSAAMTSFSYTSLVSFSFFSSSLYALFSFSLSYWFLGLSETGWQIST